MTTSLRLSVDPAGHCVHTCHMCPCSSRAPKPWGTLRGTVLDSCLQAGSKALGFRSFEGPRKGLSCVVIPLLAPFCYFTVNTRKSHEVPIAEWADEGA